MIGTMRADDLLIDGPGDARMTIILAHGAGAPMDSPYMNRVAQLLAQGRLRVVRFEFPYMQARREGRRRPPDRQPLLLDRWRDVASRFPPPSTIIGGKSMGGRMASMIADEVRPLGLVCLGYPFHAVGRSDALRVEHLEHLEHLRTPALIVQGTRDPFGAPAEVEGYRLSPTITIHWIPQADHDLKVPKKSGRTQDGNLGDAVAASLRFIASLASPVTPRETS